MKLLHDQAITVSIHAPVWGATISIPKYFKRDWNRLKLGGVAPHTGAWIETLMIDRLYQSSWVAPHTGAWIETLGDTVAGSISLSHPTRVRGLKQIRPT